MRFLIDAQLPYKLALRLQKEGCDVLHTRDLSLGNSTPDRIINDLSISEKRIVITKDEDFVQSHLLSLRPYKLLLVSTGNIKNADLELLFLHNLAQIIEGFEQYDFIEINQDNLIFHS